MTNKPIRRMTAVWFVFWIAWLCAMSAQAAEIKTVTSKYGMRTTPPPDAVAIKWSVCAVTIDADGNVVEGTWYDRQTVPVTIEPAMTIWIDSPRLGLWLWACQAVYADGTLSKRDEGTALTVMEVVPSPKAPSRPVFVAADGGG